jgi:hypothetical protein
MLVKNKLITWQIEIPKKNDVFGENPSQNRQLKECSHSWACSVQVKPSNRVVLNIAKYDLYLTKNPTALNLWPLNVIQIKTYKYERPYRPLFCFVLFLFYLFLIAYVYLFLHNVLFLRHYNQKQNMCFRKDGALVWAIGDCWRNNP